MPEIASVLKCSGTKIPITIVGGKTATVNEVFDGHERFLLLSIALTVIVITTYRHRPKFQEVSQLAEKQ
jgi:hypothetical protein